jgi:quercetin dioxygenase-like cupin family protein
MTTLALGSIPEKEIFPGYFGRMIHTDIMTLAYWRIQAGATVFEHSHVHEQVVNGLEGTFELTVNGEPLMVGPGDVVVIQSNVKHSGKAITDCRILDVFYPVREDYKNR